MSPTATYVQLGVGPMGQTLMSSTGLLTGPLPAVHESSVLLNPQFQDTQTVNAHTATSSLGASGGDSGKDSAGKNMGRTMSNMGQTMSNYVLSEKNRTLWERGTRRQDARQV